MLRLGGPVLLLRLLIHTLVPSIPRPQMNLLLMLVLRRSHMVLYTTPQTRSMEAGIDSLRNDTGSLNRFVIILLPNPANPVYPLLSSLLDVFRFFLVCHSLMRVEHVNGLEFSSCSVLLFLEYDFF